MKVLIIVILAMLLSPLIIKAQVGDVNKNVEKDKNKQETSNSATKTESTTKNNSGGWLSGLIFYTVGAGQRAALANRDIYPERVSLESFSTYGLDINSNANYFQIGIRGNWGIIGTDFKYNSLNDASGQLKTIDWMVGVIRLPIRSFKIDYGLGFIGVINQEQSYFNSMIGFDWRLQRSGLNISSAYQCQKKPLLELGLKRVSLSK